MKKSISQFRAERFVTEALLTGASHDDIEHAAKAVKFATGGATVWFRRHVRGFVAQLRREDTEHTKAMSAHRTFLDTLPRIHGYAWEKGKFGSRRSAAYRFWVSEDTVNGACTPTKIVYIKDVGEGATVEHAFAAAGLEPRA